MNKVEIYYNNVLQNMGSITIGISIIPIVIGLLFLKKLDKATKFFWIYQLFVLLINFLNWFFIWAVNNYYSFFSPFLIKFEIQNTFFLSILTYLNDIYFVGIFYSILFKSGLLKKLTYVYIFSALIIYFFIDGYHDYGSVNATLLKIFILTLSIIYINIFFQTQLNKTAFKSAYLLISLGLFLPNLFQIMFSVFAKDLDKTNFILYVKLKILTNFIDVIGYVFYCLGFWRFYSRSNFYKYPKNSTN